MLIRLLTSSLIRFQTHFDVLPLLFVYEQTLWR